MPVRVPGHILRAETQRALATRAQRDQLLHHLLDGHQRQPRPLSGPLVPRGGAAVRAQPLPEQWQVPREDTRRRHHFRVRLPQCLV